MKKQLGRVVLITGAVGGIGRALVDLFATGGDIVVAVDLPDSGVLEMARHLGIRISVSSATSRARNCRYTVASKNGFCILRCLSTMRRWGLTWWRHRTPMSKIFNSPFG